MDHTLNCVQKLVGHCQLTSSSELLTDDEAWLWLSSHNVFPSSSFIAKQEQQKIIILHFQNRFFVIGLYILKLSLQLSVMTSNNQPREKGVSIQCFRDYFLWLQHQELNTMTSLQILHYKITNVFNKIHRS